MKEEEVRKKWLEEVTKFWPVAKGAIREVKRVCSSKTCEKCRSCGGRSFMETGSKYSGSINRTPHSHHSQSTILTLMPSIRWRRRYSFFRQPLLKN